jgi:hypothetical protein
LQLETQQQQLVLSNQHTQGDVCARALVLRATPKPYTLRQLSHMLPMPQLLLLLLLLPIQQLRSKPLAAAVPAKQPLQLLANLKQHSQHAAGAAPAVAAAMAMEAAAAAIWCRGRM